MSKFNTIFLDKSLPYPTGPYQIGIQKFDLIDEFRKEVQYPAGRLIPIQIYFPTEVGPHSQFTKIIEHRRPQLFSPVSYQVYGSAKDLSLLNNKKHPLIIMNHGFTAAMSDYAAILEDLASNGYIVVAIQHQLDTDIITEPPFWKSHSFSLHSNVIDNLLYVFNWLQMNQKTIFYDRLDCSKVGLIGHSMGSNALLLLTNRTKKNSKIEQKKTLLPHNDKEKAKECIMVFDFDISFAFLDSSQYPIFFLTSEEREIILKDKGIFEDIKACGHRIEYYKFAKHISFLDHGYINPTDPCVPNETYFNGTMDQRRIFFENVRKDLINFLKNNDIIEYV